MKAAPVWEDKMVALFDKVLLNLDGADVCLYMGKTHFYGKLTYVPTMCKAVIEMPSATSPYNNTFTVTVLTQDVKGINIQKSVYPTITI